PRVVDLEIAGIVLHDPPGNGLRLGLVPAAGTGRRVEGSRHVVPGERLLRTVERGIIRWPAGYQQALVEQLVAEPDDLRVAAEVLAEEQSRMPVAVLPLGGIAGGLHQAGRGGAGQPALLQAAPPA